MDCITLDEEDVRFCSHFVLHELNPFDQVISEGNSWYVLRGFHYLRLCNSPERADLITDYMKARYPEYFL